MLAEAPRWEAHARDKTASGDYVGRNSLYRRSDAVMKVNGQPMTA